MTATKTGPPRPSISPVENAAVRAGNHVVQLTKLDKIFWPELDLTKRHLLQDYVDAPRCCCPI